MQAQLNDFLLISQHFNYTDIESKRAIMRINIAAWRYFKTFDVIGTLCFQCFYDLALIIIYIGYVNMVELMVVEKTHKTRKLSIIK